MQRWCGMEGSTCRRTVLALMLGLCVVDLASAQTTNRESPAMEAPPIPVTATEPQGFVDEPLIIQRAVLFGERNLGGSGTGEGLRADFGKMIPGAGWISIGPAYRRYF